MNTPSGRHPALLPALVESSLEQGVEACFEVDGHSMMPLIRPGDIVHLRRVTGGVPRVGDVVAVRGMPDGGLLVHRVERVRGDRIAIRGDNTTIANGEFSRGDIVGTVTKVHRKGRGVWFGAGHWGALIALAARTGVLRRYNRSVSLAARISGRHRQGPLSGSA